jgi:membrane protein implicated in regulation of membrane protease activity
MKRDLRNYARQTNVRLIIGALLILLIVGEGLIFLIYGPAAAVSGLICIGIGLFPVALIISIFAFMDWISKRANRE